MNPMKIDPSEYESFRNELDEEQRPCHTGIECAVRDILTAVGEDLQREGLVRTPERVSRMFEELTAGYHVDPKALINGAVFEVQYDEMVIIRDIDFFSMCEHHLLPFYGQVHVAYLPYGRVLGLSKIPRIVEMFARRLQLQERMTQQIAEFIRDEIEPWGVGVVVRGIHMCSIMRGVKKANVRMVTSSMLGTFKTNEATRQEFLSHLIRGEVARP